MPDPKQVIVTTNGIDNACCAALVLLKFPDAEMYVTSARGLHARLEKIYSEHNRGDFLHICGVGISKSEAREITRTIGLMNKHGWQVFWYSSNPYIREYEKALSPHCTCVFTDHETNTASASSCIDVPESAKTGFLLRLAEQHYVKGEKDPDFETWCDFIAANSFRYFNYGDGDAVIQGFRTLAFNKKLSREEEKRVSRYINSEMPSLLLGNSPVMKQVRASIVRAARFHEHVLILGPTGTGKELVARAIHEESGRRGQFRAVNCAEISVGETTAISRLFGHKKGSFTGAQRDKKGEFQLSDKGTLFLDELGELTPSLQTLLLRALETGTVMPLGAENPVKVDMRIITATNRDLAAMMKAGKFRDDLVYRLNLLTIIIPALADRPHSHKLADIKPVLSTMQYECDDKYGYWLPLGRKDREAIYTYHWPGNIRQLENTLRRAAINRISVREAMNQSLLLQPDARSEEKELLELFHPTSKDQVKDWKTIRNEYTSHVLKIFDGNITQTAKALGISQNTLRDWLR